MARKYGVGYVFTSNKGGDCVIISTEANNKRCVVIKWQDSFGHEQEVTASNALKGEISNPYAKTVMGVGYFGVGRYKSVLSGKRTPEYETWSSMLERCYDEVYQNNKPTYIACSVCDEWLCFQTFAEWVTSQVGWGNKGWHLDKDLLSVATETKIYSPETCVLLPPELNRALTKTSIRSKGLDFVKIIDLAEKYKNQLDDRAYESLTKIKDKS